MQLKMHMITIEDLVPQDHFFRKLEAALNLSFVRAETAQLYSHRYGRPPIDPVVLVKYLLVGYLYGIPSERQIEQRIQTDNAHGNKFAFFIPQLLQPPTHSDFSADSIPHWSVNWNLLSVNMTIPSSLGERPAELRGGQHPMPCSSGGVTETRATSTGRVVSKRRGTSKKKLGGKVAPAGGDGLAAGAAHENGVVAEAVLQLGGAVAALPMATRWTISTF